jgi:hypothetical protein
VSLTSSKYSTASHCVGNSAHSTDGLSILLEGRDYHKTHCDDSKHWAGMVDFMR